MLYGAGGASSAEDVSYDNTTSGLEADNVQDAIDEVSAARIYVKTFPQVTINPSSGTASFVEIALEGYTTIGYRIQNASNLTMGAVKIGKDGNLYVNYNGSSPISGDVYAYYIKTSELIELT